MRAMFLGLVLSALSAFPAFAATFEHCSKSEISYATDAINGASEIVLRAAAMVSDIPEYQQWFGNYTKENGETVRRTLKAIDRALQSDSLKAVCPNTGEDGCDLETFANVWPDTPYVINLCPSFFRMPSMLGVVHTSYAFDTGTREGTIIHEVSHFDIVGGTEDECYGREVCTDMARTEADRVVHNADSFQYFAEDINFAYPMPEE